MLEIVQTKDGNSRQIRGLFNFVGKVSKELFGNIDDEDSR